MRLMVIRTWSLVREDSWCNEGEIARSEISLLSTGGESKDGSSWKKAPCLEQNQQDRTARIQMLLEGCDPVN